MRYTGWYPEPMSSLRMLSLLDKNIDVPYQAVVILVLVSAST